MTPKLILARSFWIICTNVVTHIISFMGNELSLSLTQKVAMATYTPKRVKEKQTKVDCLKLDKNSYSNTTADDEKDAKSHDSRLINSEQSSYHEEPSISVITKVQMTTTTTSDSPNQSGLVSNCMVMSNAVFNNLNANEIQHELERFHPVMSTDDSCDEYTEKSPPTNTPASRTSNESTSILYVNPAPSNRIKSSASTSDESDDPRNSKSNVSSSSYSYININSSTSQTNNKQRNQPADCDQSYLAYHNKILKLRRDLERRKELICKLLLAAFEQNKKAAPQRKLMFRACKNCRQVERDAKFESQQCGFMPKVKSPKPQIDEIMRLREYLHKINRVLKFELANLERQLIVIRQCTDKTELKKLKKKILKSKLRRDQAKNTLMDLINQCGSENTFGIL